MAQASRNRLGAPVRGLRRPQESGEITTGRPGRTERVNGLDWTGQMAHLGMGAATGPRQRIGAGGPDPAPSTEEPAREEEADPCSPERRLHAPPPARWRHSRVALSRAQAESLRRGGGKGTEEYTWVDTEKHGVEAMIRTPSGIKIQTGLNCQTTAARNQGGASRFPSRRVSERAGRA